MRTRYCPYHSGTVLDMVWAPLLDPPRVFFGGRITW